MSQAAGARHWEEKAPCLGVAALIPFCVCGRKEDGGARTAPLPLPIPGPARRVPRQPCPATKGCIPSQQTNQAFKFNSCRQPRRFKVIRHLIRAHVLLCWLGGKFLRRAREICAGDRHGARQMLFAIPMSDEVLMGSPALQVTPFVPSIPMHPRLQTALLPAPVLRQSQSRRRARGLGTCHCPGKLRHAEGRRPQSKVGSGGCVFIQEMGGE